jgi:glycopeptide antibiotics resistance protein
MKEKGNNKVFILLISLAALLVLTSVVFSYMGRPYLGAIPGGLACVALVLASPFTQNQSTKKALMVLSFTLYLIFLLAFTLFGRSLNPIFTWGNIWEGLKYRIYLTPFKNIEYYGKILWTSRWREAVINFFGNLAALAPLSFFFPRLYEKAYNRKVYLAVLLGVVTFIEISQLILGCGVFDIDDFILNMSGAWVAYEILSTRKMRKRIDTLLGKNE